MSEYTGNVIICSDIRYLGIGLDVSYSHSRELFF
jgi:hypothetical protein